MSVEILSCTTSEQLAYATERAVAVLQDDGLVILPTETVYGLAANAASPRAMKRLRQVKFRPDVKPFTVHLGYRESVMRYIDPSLTMRRLIEKTWPGPVTYVVEVDQAVIAAKCTSNQWSEAVGREIYHDGCVGLRCPDHSVAAMILSEAIVPVVASSANVHGDPPPIDADSAIRSIGSDVDLIIDAGPCRYAGASTIVKVAGDDISILREGMFTERYIEKLLRMSFLFVCSGNTCRSPMAEAIARHELARRLDVSADSLEKAGFDVASAGAFANTGSPMTAEAHAALQSLGVDVHAHRSQPLSYELLAGADHIYGMTDSHRAAVGQVMPSVADKVKLLDPAGAAIEDPIGGSGDVYLRCARQLQQLIRDRLEQLQIGSDTAGISSGG